MKLDKAKVLVTGSEGFIGSHLTESLVKLGAEVTALVQYNSFNSWGWLDTFNKPMLDSLKVVTGDIREYDNISKIVKGHDVVFHLAALIAIPYSYQSPAAYVRANVEGTLNVLEACKNHDVQRMVHTSTSEVYGTACYVPIDETHPLQGQSPYSASKIGADKMAESYFASFRFPVATIRPFNTYGPRQSARAIIPSIISQLLTGAETIRLGSLTPTRDLNYVGDTVAGFIRVAEVDACIGQTVNIGSGREISMGDLAATIMDIIGYKAAIECDENRVRPENSEVLRLLCDAGKAHSFLGWEPKESLESGLKKTIDWFRMNNGNYKSGIYNV